MRSVMLFIFLFVGTLFIGAQAYSGKGDQKFQVGATLQDNGTGIIGYYDYGLGPNISVGANMAYILGINRDIIDDGARERFDFRARFSAHLGSVIGFNESFDIYPGLNLGLKNFGFHLGSRYFFSEGFGIFTEIGFPIARYKINPTPTEKLQNQFTVNIGAAFNFL